MKTNATGAIVTLCAGLIGSWNVWCQASRPNASETNDPASPTTRFSERNPRYRVQPNDTIEVHFSLTPEFNFNATLQPDGYISSQITGDIHVDGMTTSEISKAVAEKASARLK